MSAGKKLFLTLALGLFTFVAFGQTSAQAQTAVDLELVLAVDSSFSINDDEFNLQQLGYSAAFRQAAIYQAIEALPNGIAVSLVYWSSDAVQVLDPGGTGFFHITDQASAEAFADFIDAAVRPANGNPPGIGTQTDIGGAINLSSQLLQQNNFQGERVVIDVSGDGSDNNGDDLESARTSFLNTLFGAGVTNTINGLAITNDPNEPVNQPGEIGLFEYYRQFVIGGGDAFAFSAEGFCGPDVPGSVDGMNNFECFRDAIFAKLLFEITGPGPNGGVVPEPATVLLFGGGLCAYAARRRKMKQ